MIVETLFFAAGDVVVPSEESGNQFIDVPPASVIPVSASLVRMKGPDGNFIPYESVADFADWQFVMDNGSTATGLTTIVNLETDQDITITGGPFVTLESIGGGALFIKSTNGGEIELRSDGIMGIISENDVIQLVADSSVNITSNTAGIQLNPAVGQEVTFGEAANLQTNKIINLGNPTATKDAVNLEYITSQTGIASPSGVVTPRYIGDSFVDTALSDIYMAFGVGINDWKKVSP